MISQELEEAIKTMKSRNIPLREIARSLNVARNTVKNALKNKKSQKSTHEQDHQVIQELFKRCKGNVIRVQEVLSQEHDQEIAYSTLTRIVRKIGLRAPVKKRAGSYNFGPGEEMQHDTSPHRFSIGGKTVTGQCAAVVLFYSRLTYMQYYPRFTRFEAKVFLQEAAVFFGGMCGRCVIDNTSVMVASGSGYEAVIAPEMERFGALFGYTFFPHCLNHPDRKARVERFFHYTENNFLAGRTFTDWFDLNEQAKMWCEQQANQRHHKQLGMSPQAAFVMEKPYLTPLPAHLPPAYQSLRRKVDIEGYFAVDTIRYSAPESLIGVTLDVQKHWKTIKAYHKRKLVADHFRHIGSARNRVTDPAHHHGTNERKRKQRKRDEEKALLGKHDELDSYVMAFKKRGVTVRQFRVLLEFYRTYPREPLLKALRDACHYGLFDLKRLERMILANMADNFLRGGYDDESI